MALKSASTNLEIKCLLELEKWTNKNKEYSQWTNKKQLLHIGSTLQELVFLLYALPISNADGFPEAYIKSSKTCRGYHLDLARIILFCQNI